jgi:glycosyltransferase involved in cell wall biosynthesis
LTIAGEGELRPQLAQQIAALGLGDRVSLSGTYSNPREILKDADLFILSSAFEGFPNTLAEAMAHGVPVISFDCRSGPSEIIRNGVDGLLVPPCDVPALAAAMEKLMSNEALRLSMGKRAVEVSERFSVDKILRAWDDLFEQLGAPVSRSRQSASRPLDGVLGGDAR